MPCLNCAPLQSLLAVQHRANSHVSAAAHSLLHGAGFALRASLACDQGSGGDSVFPTPNYPPLLQWLVS